MLGRGKSKLLRVTAMLGVGVVAFAGLVVADTVNAPAAEAATITVPSGQNVQAQMSTHVGWTQAAPGGSANAESGDDYRFGSATNGTTSGSISNTGGSAGTSGQEYSNGYTAYVSSGTTAWTAHGNESGSGGQLSLSNQSALGFAPRSIASFDTGTIINLGRMAHSNNPVNVDNRYFRGDMNIQFMGMTLSYRWQMDETPNSCSGAGCSDDYVNFLNQISPQTFTGPDGLTYTLTIRGFVAPQGQGNSCTPVLGSIGNVINQFRTVESTTTYGCLYASVDQVRQLEVKKVVVSPYGTAPAQNFAFTRTSTLAGSPWSGANFTLANGQNLTQNYTSGETVVIGETAQTDPWSFTSLSCVDGAGASVGTVSGRQVTIPAGTTAATAAASKITCTYTNTYTPRATLTLKKNVVSTGQPAPVAVPAHWTLTAAGTGAVTGQGLTGPGNSGAGISQSVIAGTYALSELPNNTSTTTGYQASTWVCVNNLTSLPVTVTNGNVTLANNQNVTCTITNTFKTGSLQITKTVSGGGYALGTTKPFTAQYVCNPGNITGTRTVYPNATNGQAGAAVTVSNLPAGVSCTVTEINAPSGSTDLVNGSWTWNAPSNPTPVVIPDGGSVTVNIGNSASQQTGTFQVTKTVTPRDGTPAPGYTGGTARPFPVQYQCVLGGNTVSSGTLQVTPGTPAVVTGVPATATCSITNETLTGAAGDFADASYSWDGYTVSAQSAVVPAGGTATLGVTNYFKRTLVDLNLAKVVTGAGYIGSGENFTVTYNCGTVNGSVTLAAGATKTVQVPAGVQCSVQENPLPGQALLAEGYVWDAPSYTGLTGGVVTVPAGQSATVTVTNNNRIGFGRVSVTKAIANHGSAVTSGTTFDITVACDAPAQGQDDDYSNVFTLSWPNPATELTPYLPIGTSCTVTETSLPSGSSQLIDSSYAWAAAPPAQQVTVPTSTTPALVTVTNDITRVYGAFSITKNVVNNTSATHDGFSGGFACTYAPTGTVVSGSWTAPAAGGPATLTPDGGATVSVLAGSSCTVTEVDPAIPGGDTSYSWSKSLPGATTVVAGQTANAVVGNTLNRSTGSFSVSKSVSGGEAGTAFVDGAFTFDYTCIPLSGDPINGTLTAPAGGSASPTETIPTGASCTVTEIAMPDPIDPYTWDGVSFQVDGVDSGDSASFTIGDTSVAVVATNAISKKTVDVTVSKAVVDPDGGFVDTSQTFPITLVCDGVSLETKDVAAGTGAEWTVDLGATCNATEGTITATLKDASFAWGSPSYDPASVTVDSVDGQYSIAVTNTVTRVYGEIGLRKVFDDGGFTGVVDPAKVYSGTWICSYPGADDVTGGWSALGNETATLTGDYDHVLLSSSCTATESDLGSPSSDPSYSWADPVFTPITVGADATANVVQVTNTLTRQTGSLDVEKVITGETSGYDPADDFAGFAVTASCSYPGVQGVMEQTVNVLPGAAVPLITGVPAGWTCEVAEASTATLNPNQLFDGSFAWGSTTVEIDGDETDSVEVASGETNHVVIANDITRVLGTVQVTKVITTPQAVKGDADFSGAYSCTYTGPDGEVKYEGTWTRTGAGVATLSGDTEIPIGAECSVTEDTSDLESDELIDASWVWGEPVLSDPAVVSSVDQPAALTVSNHAERVYASFDIEKSYTGPENAFANPDQIVTGTWSCTYDGATVAAGTWAASATGGPGTAFGDRSAIPATSVCVVTEDSLPTGVFRDGSYAWGAHPAPQQVELVSGQTPLVTIANVVTRVTGGFTITKTLERGDGVSQLVPPANLQYTGTYECIYDGTSTGPLAWSVQAGGTWESPDTYYVGTQCRILDESLSPPVPGDDSYVWGSPSLGDTVTVPAPGGSVPQITVANTLHRIFGSFSVTKAFQGDATGLPANPQYTFQWSCIADNGDQFPVTESDEFTIAAGGLWQPTENIPVGSLCTVTELTGELPTPTDPSYTWSTAMAVVDAKGEPVIDGASATFELPDASDPPAPAPQVTATNTLTRTIGSYTIDKSSDPVSGSTVEPGDTITYTVTVTPGEVGFVDDVVVTDDLSQVTPYATLDEDSISASQGTAAPSSGDTLVWDVGRVNVGDPLVLTYEVKVNAGQWGVELRNAITATGEEPPSECPECTTTTEHYTPAWEIEKTSDPTSGSAVVAGDVITYRLTARNTTEHALVSGATATDNLADVLAYADLVEPLPAEITRSGDVLTWAIPDLGVDEENREAFVEYQVTVKPGFNGVALVNGVEPGDGGECVGECETTHYTPKWNVAKTSDPASGTSVLPGSEIAYTLTLHNEGRVPVQGAKVIDDLSGVVANAELLEPLPAGLTLSGDELTWEPGEVAVDGQATVTYRVKVHDEARGVTLRNAITPDGPGGECTENCTTTHSVPAWTLSKTSAPGSGTSVKPGQTVTYTLTAKNLGEATLSGALGIDDLSGVLGHATLDTPLDPTLALSGETLTWNIPDLAPGDTATVSYSVVVNGGASNVKLRNVVVPGGAPGGECVDSCSTTHEVPPKPGIPVTGGSSLVPLAVGGGVLLLLGAAIAVWAARRRRSTEEQISAGQ